MSVYIYTSDNKCVYLQLYENSYLCIHTFIRVVIFICVIKELKKIKSQSFCVLCWMKT